MNIKNLIRVHDFAQLNISALEASIQNKVINNEKDKANFGNLCVALKGFRLVSDATQAILENEEVLKAEDGAFYQKVDMAEKAQSDSDNDPKQKG